ncbi:MAG: PASTA domain-containing protein [Alistipes sp.]
MEKTSSFWQKFKERPVLYNLSWIIAILVVLGLAAHILMLVGTRHGAHRVVPELTGISLQEAEELADQEGLQVMVNDSLYIPAYEGGVVLDQLPEKGVEVKPGRTIYITINSFTQKIVPIPYVAGRSLRQAKNMLEIAGLEIARLIYRDDVATNFVLEEHYKGKRIQPKNKLTAPAGSGITLYIGIDGGSGITVAPKIVGASLKEAKSRLWESGLNVGRVIFDKGITLLNQKDARVYEQTPSQGRNVSYGELVNIKLSLDENLVRDKNLSEEKRAKELEEQRLRQRALEADSIAKEEFRQATEQGDDTNINTESTTDEFLQ